MRRRKIRKSAFPFAAVLIIICGAVLFIALRNGASGKTSPASKANSSENSKTINSSSKQVDGSSFEVSSKTGSLTMLINKTHKLTSDYTPDFSRIPINYYSSSSKDNRFDSRAAPYLIKFVSAARKAGYDVNIISGYRTYSYQQNNFDRHVKALTAKGESLSQAQSDAAKLVAPPGTSEHQSGLAADIITSDWYTKNNDLTGDFDKTSAFKWMYAHCSDYGFILRYPKDKVDITKYEYEPWHYRFVGIKTAKKIMNSGICLEEYLEGK